MEPKLSGERIRAVYRVAGSEAEARARTEDICIEQTVELPPDLVKDASIREGIFGRVEALGPADTGGFEATVSFAVEATAFELTQLLNLVFGNISLKPGIRLERLELPERLRSALGGPRFGRQGLRRLVGAKDRPLIASALKPMGESPQALAEQAHALAIGGIDLIKDDHGLSNQPFCPYSERVARCCEAVAKANDSTGLRSIYLPNITAPAPEVRHRALEAVARGAGGLVVSAGIVGLDAARALAADDEIGVPLLLHPALLGSFTTDPSSGISHYALYGQIARLAGADGCIFPHHGGRFTFSEAECLDLAAGTACDMEPLRSIFPVPAGGMTFDRIADICSFYDGELVLLIGGDIRRHGSSLVEGCQCLREIVVEWARDRA